MLTQYEREELYIPVVATAFKNAGFDPAFGCAIARQESNWTPDAKSNNSGDLARGGAFGLCQMTMKTAVALGHLSITPKDLLDPAINASIAAELCVANAKHVRVTVLAKKPLNLEAYYEDLAALYNSGKVYKDAPFVTKGTYCVRVLEFWRQYQKHPLVLAIDAK